MKKLDRNRNRNPVCEGCELVAEWSVEGDPALCVGFGNHWRASTGYGRRQCELPAGAFWAAHCFHPQRGDPPFGFRPLRLSPRQVEAASLQSIRRLVVPDRTRRAALDALRQRVRSRSGLGYEQADADWQHRHTWQSGGALPSRLPTCRRGRVFRAISLDRLAGGPCEFQVGRRTYRVPGIAGRLRGSRRIISPLSMSTPHCTLESCN